MGFTIENTIFGLASGTTIFFLAKLANWISDTVEYVDALKDPETAKDIINYNSFASAMDNLKVYNHQIGSYENLYEKTDPERAERFYRFIQNNEIDAIRRVRIGFAKDEEMEMKKKYVEAFLALKRSCKTGKKTRKEEFEEMLQQKLVTDFLLRLRDLDFYE